MELNTDLEFQEMFQKLDGKDLVIETEDLRVRYLEAVQNALQTFSEFDLDSFFDHFAHPESKSPEKNAMALGVVTSIEKKFILDLKSQDEFFDRVALAKMNHWIDRLNSSIIERKSFSEIEEIDKLGDQIEKDLLFVCRKHEQKIFDDTIRRKAVLVVGKFGALRKWAERKTDFSRPIAHLDSIPKFFELVESDV